MEDIDRKFEVTQCGWFAFEGFGRPYEGWIFINGGWKTVGRAFTRRGAKRKAKRSFMFFSNHIKRNS